MKKVKKTDKLTKEDVNRWVAWFGAAFILIAMIVSVAASVLWLLGIGSLMFAFREWFKDARRARRRKR